ncbi:MAG: mercuric transporter MerT family protein [Gemmatimonadaceae bacterium]
MPRKGLFAALGAVGAAFLASLCCVGPLVFVAFGVGAGLASSFEPLRPLFTVLTLALLAVGFYVVYGRRRTVSRADGMAGGSDGSCAAPRYSVRDRISLWVATLMALVFLTFPQWSVLFI